jgi:hypothetical protein
MLALKVTRGENNVLQTEPRPLTLDGPVLSITSAHDISVHRGWPAALLRNQLSMTSVELREEGAQRAIDRFTRHFASDAVIQVLRYEALKWRSNDWMCRNALSAGGRKLNKSSSSIAWLVVPGHPALRCFKEINRVINALQRDSFWASAWRSLWQCPSPIIKLSWRNCLRHAVHVFQSIGFKTSSSVL